MILLREAIPYSLDQRIPIQISHTPITPIWVPCWNKSSKPEDCMFWGALFNSIGQCAYLCGNTSLICQRFTLSDKISKYTHHHHCTSAFLQCSILGSLLFHIWVRISCEITWKPDTLNETLNPEISLKSSDFYITHYIHG